MEVLFPKILTSHTINIHNIQGIFIHKLPWKETFFFVFVSDAGVYQ